MKKLITLIFGLMLMFAISSCASCKTEGTCDSVDTACAEACNSSTILEETCCATCNVGADAGCTIEWK